MSARTLFLGELWSPDPDDSERLVVVPEGAIGVEQGRICALGTRDELMPVWNDAKQISSPLILPGFVDTHVHFPQLDMIGSPGEELMGWLTHYTYPAEKRYAARAFAEQQAPRFFDMLYAHGTTTAAIYGTTHAHTAHALLTEAKGRGGCAVVGKVSMDREGPVELLQDCQADRKDQEALIQSFHGVDGRLFVALTPRFAISCTPELMKSLGELKAADDTLFVQTHHAENHEEIAYTAKLFPDADHYVGVYDSFGLLSSRTILGHSIHVTDAEWQVIADRRASIAHCPTSNAFLGSGLFAWDVAHRHHIGISLATDVGAGTDLSQWRTMGMAYNIQSLRGHRLSAANLFFHATVGGAQALGLENEIGSLQLGRRADFQLIDPSRHPLLSQRFIDRATPEECLFAMITTGDSRMITGAVIAGELFG